MRFSAVAALCAAPLALASSLQADLVARRAVSAEVGKPNGNSKANSGNDIVVQASSSSNSITEVIIIWVNNGGGAATTTINSATSTKAGATMATHSVVVGGSAGLVYFPEFIEAAVGDMVVFTFMSNNHTATQSAFTTPCEKLTGGMDSGFMPNVNNTVNPAPQMAMQVTVATPIWFYCRQSGHCGKGMTFSINPTQNKTQAMFKQMAVAQNGTGTAAVIAGGAGAASASAAAAATTVAVAASATASAAAIQTASSGSMVSGTGSMDTNGQCQCSCLCGTAAFPNAAIQGIGAFGGMSGAMPMSALEVRVSTS